MSENAVTTMEPKSVVPANDSGQVLQIISQLASDPSANIDKLERLMALHERMEAAKAEAAFNAAMTAAQSEMGRVSADATNKHTDSHYATYGKLDRVLRPIYTKHGFSLSFDEAESPKPEHVRVVCYVSHNAGHSRTYHRDMPADGKGAKGGDVMTKTHATGSAHSYGARYLLKGIFNVAIGKEDDDGNAAGGVGEPISKAQREHLEKLIKDAKADRAKYLETLGVERLEDLPAKSFRIASVALNARIKAAKTEAPE